MALSIRERFNDGRGVGEVGTLNRPRNLPVKLDNPNGYRQNLDVRLGFEAMPSTQFWQFHLDQPAVIRASRHSSDPYAVHVAVALLGPDSTMGAYRLPLVHTADGEGQWHEIPKGRWWLIVACGLPIQIQLEIGIHIRPHWAEGSVSVPRSPFDSLVLGRQLRRPEPVKPRPAVLLPRPLRSPRAPVSRQSSTARGKKLKGNA